MNRRPNNRDKLHAECQAMLLNRRMIESPNVISSHSPLKVERRCKGELAPVLN